MAFRSFSMKETDVKYMPKVGDRVQAQTRGINYNNGELGEVVFVDRQKTIKRAVNNYFSHNYSILNNSNCL